MTKKEIIRQMKEKIKNDKIKIGKNITKEITKEVVMPDGRVIVFRN